jgi:His-Xaa-Ser system protein HxsD
MNKKITVSLSENTAEAVRYAAYTCTDDFWVQIQPSGNNTLEVFFSPRKDKETDQAEKRFTEELADEKIREKSRKHNIAASEMIIRNAMSKLNPSFVHNEQPALSVEQEQELDDLIAEVEKELQEEMNSSGSDDAQHITQTWEEVNKNGK